jgi:hypothetical protein
MLSLTGIKGREAYGPFLRAARIARLLYPAANGPEDSGRATQEGRAMIIRKLSAGLVAGVVCAALAFAGTAIARSPADTGVTIRGDNGDFHGKVLSERSSCEVGRTVVLYKQKGSKQDPSVDKVIGKDTSERQGNVGVWSAGNTGFKHGKFYAKAKRSPGCATGYSKTIHL